MRRGSGMLAALGLFLALGREAAADTITYDVGSFHQPGFSASFIHRAGGSGSVQPGDGVTYYMGGANLYGLSGAIEAERDLGAGRIDFVGGVLFADSLGLSGRMFGFDTSRDLTILITGGWLLESGPEDRPGGFLLTRFKQGSRRKKVYFYFAPFEFSGDANGFLAPEMSEWVVWGNNTRTRRWSRLPYGRARRRIGIDLHARFEQTPTPEPATLLLVGAAIAGGMAYRRKRRAGADDQSSV